MNFIVSSSTLLRHLQSISGVLNTSNTLPILDNFLFDIQDGLLTVSASDLETTMITKLEVQSEENGKIAIPAKLIMDVLKNLPEQPCTIRSNKETSQIEIAYDNGKSKMVGFNGDEFPKLPTIENKNDIRFSGDILVKGINKTLFATGNDDLRPVMSGVFFQFSPSDITLVSSQSEQAPTRRSRSAGALSRYSKKDDLASQSSHSRRSARKKAVKKVIDESGNGTGPGSSPSPSIVRPSSVRSLE
ncbi:MAG: DNA polymerase III subunit beta, partial [Crocinitomicaceae bacterium]